MFSGSDVVGLQNAVASSAIDASLLAPLPRRRLDRFADVFSPHSPSLQLVLLFCGIATVSIASSWMTLSGSCAPR